MTLEEGLLAVVSIMIVPHVVLAYTAKYKCALCGATGKRKTGGFHGKWYGAGSHVAREWYCCDCSAPFKFREAIRDVE